MKNHALKVLLLLLAAGGAWGADPVKPAPAVAADSGQPRSFEEYQRAARDEALQAYVVEGDIVIRDVQQLRAWFDAQSQARVQALGTDHVNPKDGSLVINRVDGRRDAWNDTQKKNLVYCVSEKFGEHRAAVREAMAQATEDWERAANVKFRRESLGGEHCRPRPEANSAEQVFFSVEPPSTQPMGLNAVAFFPSAPPEERRIILNFPRASSRPPKTVAGILRHELGHVLGFRHEHVVPNSCQVPTETEPGSWEQITPLDRRSVMLYMICREYVGDYVISDLDRQGASKIYGCAP